MLRSAALVLLLVVGTAATGHDKCSVYSSCSDCGKDTQCAWCLDTKGGSCKSDWCRHWASRDCHCEDGYAALFPGDTMTDKGPCKEVMSQNFAPGTCTAAAGAQCTAAVKTIVSACQDKKIPNIPVGNPTANKMFDEGFSQRIIGTFDKAGCKVGGNRLAVTAAVA